MSKEISELKWRWREHRDGDVGKARFKCFDVRLQDCDGDFCEWQIKRGTVYVAMGQERDIEPAQAKVMEVLAFLWRAVEMNDFVNHEMPKLKARGIT